MFRTIEREWGKLRHGTPGTRFQAVQQAHASSTASRWIGTVLGTALILAGIVALPLPGPGTVLIALGVGLLSRESPRVARTADWVEVQARKLWRRGRRLIAR